MCNEPYLVCSSEQFVAVIAVVGASKWCSAVSATGLKQTIARHASTLKLVAVVAVAL